MERKYMSAEEKELRRKLEYHATCMEQYASSAAYLANPKRKQRVLDNAEWHAKQHKTCSDILRNLSPNRYL